MSTALDPLVEDARCVCTHSINAHGLHGDPGCSFCHCRQFSRPAAVHHDVELGKYAAMALDLLSHDPSLSSMPKEALVDVVKDGHGRMFAEGTCLVSRGDRSHALHVVLSGNVMVEPKEAAAGLQAGAGEVVGDLRALTEEPRWASVYAVDSVVALEVDTAKLRPVFAKFPELFMALVQWLGKYSENTDEVINATIEAALEQHSTEEAHERREGLDPSRVMELQARWRKLKEEDRAAADRAREVAQQAIDQQTTRRH